MRATTSTIVNRPQSAQRPQSASSTGSSVSFLTDGLLSSAPKPTKGKEGGMLRRRSSTPNTMRDLVGMFSACQLGDDEVGELIPSALAQQTRVAGNRHSASEQRWTRPVSAKLIRPQTVAFLRLLTDEGAVESSATCLASQQANSRTTNVLRPSTAPLRRCAAPIRLLRTESPQAAPMQSLRTPLATCPPSSIAQLMPSKDILSVTSSARLAAEVFFAADADVEAALTSSTTSSSMQVITQSLRMLVAYCAHADAAAHSRACVRNAPRRDAVRRSDTPYSSVCFPLPRTSPWSRIDVTFAAEKSRLVVRVASPSSKLIGLRVLERFLQVLNDRVTCISSAVGALIPVGLISAAQLRCSSDDASVTQFRESIREPDGALKYSTAANDSACEPRTSFCARSLDSLRRCAAAATDGLVSEWDASVTDELANSFSGSSMSASPSKRSRRTLPAGVVDECDDRDLGARRVSMFHGTSKAMLRAVASIRELSSESSPLTAPSGKHDGVGAFSSRRSSYAVTRRESVSELHRLRKLSQFLIALPHHQRRKKIAVVIAVSTYADAAVPCCERVEEYAEELVRCLCTEVNFDVIIPMQSARPVSELHTPTMRNIRKVAENIVAEHLIDEPVEPLVCFFVLSRGGVANPGTIMGITSRSEALAPFPSVAYCVPSGSALKPDEVRAQQPALGVKFALLETASHIERLSSTDVVTPEMFSQMLQANGKEYKPLVFFDVWPLTTGPKQKLCAPLTPVRQGSDGCGFCGLYNSAAPETDFTAVPRRGVGGLGIHYLVKLLRGGLLFHAAKEHVKRLATAAEADKAASSLPPSVTRFVLSNLTVSMTDVHHYIVERLKRRNCNTMYSAMLHVNIAASTKQQFATEPDSLGASVTAASDTVRNGEEMWYAPFELQRLATQLDLVHSLLSNPSEKILELALDSSVDHSSNPPTYMYSMHIAVSIFKAARRYVAPAHELTVFAWPNWSALISSAAALAREQVPVATVRVWSCTTHSRAVAQLFFLRSSDDTELCREILERDLSVVAMDALTAIVTRDTTAGFSKDDVLVELSVVTSTLLFQLREPNSSWSHRMVDSLRQWGAQFNLKGCAGTQMQLIKLSVVAELHLEMTKRHAMHVQRGVCLQSFRRLGNIVGCSAIRLCDAPSSAELSGDMYSRIRRIQSWWRWMLPQRRAFVALYCCRHVEEELNRRMLIDSEAEARRDILVPCVYRKMREIVALQENSARAVCQLSEVIEFWSEHSIAQRYRLFLETTLMHNQRCALEAAEMEHRVAVSETCLRQCIDAEWRAPFVSRDDAKNVLPCLFDLSMRIDVEELNARRHIEQIECGHWRVMWDVAQDMFETLGFSREQVVLPIPADV